MATHVMKRQQSLIYVVIAKKYSDMAIQKIDYKNHLDCFLLHYI